jgi:predicted secreted protein
MATAGINRKIYITTIVTNATVNTWIAGETSNSFDISDSPIDVSDKESAWDAFISGQKTWSASADFNLDNSSTGKQKELLQNLITGTKVKIFIGIVSGTTPVQTDGIAGEAIIESISESAEKGGIVSRSISFKGTGAPTPVFPA